MTEPRKPRVHIVCTDGVTTGVSILIDGKPVEDHVTAITWKAEAGDGLPALTTATITFEQVTVDVRAALEQ